MGFTEALNIYWVCHGKALTVEEIGRALGVVAIYLEDRIDKLLYMDYIKTVGKNKYQTNFFIPDAKYQLTDRKFHLENTSPMAKQFYQVIEKMLSKVKEIDFVAADSEDDYLTWQLIPTLIFRTIQKIDYKIIESRNLHHSATKRKDGTKHWACASARMSDILENTPDIPKELREFCMQSSSNGIKMPSNGSLHSLQFDLGFAGGYRNWGAKELSQLRRVKEIIEKRELPNDYDIEIISNLVSMGYVSNLEENLKILIPYFTVSQMQEFNDLLQKYSDEILNEKEIEKTFIKYIEIMSKEIPVFVDNNERSHLLTGFSPYITIIWSLYKNGYLKERTEEEKRRLCTIVWEN